MKKLGNTAEAAMDLLDVPTEERSMYLKQL